jgi:hypothetical protein
LTVSIGGSLVRSDDANARQVLERSDQALYRGEAGRDDLAIEDTATRAPDAIVRTSRTVGFEAVGRGYSWIAPSPSALLGSAAAARICDDCGL